MNIIFAFDKFKGSMTSLEAAEAAKNGIHLACGDIGIDEQTLRYITLPVADGGEGTVEAFLSSLGGKRLMCNVTPPHRHPKKDEEKVQAEYGILPDGTCVIEMAAASGLRRQGMGVRRAWALMASCFCFNLSNKIRSWAACLSMRKASSPCSTMI